MRIISKSLCIVLLLVGLSMDSPVALTSARPFRRTPMEIRDKLHFDVEGARSAAARYQAAILVFSLGNPRSYLRVVTAKDYVDFTLPAGREIDAEVKQYVGLIAAPPRGGSAEDYRSLSTRLYDELLRPVEPVLKTKRLLIVPDASLSALPFETLISDPQTGGRPRFLAEDFTLSVIPSVPQFLSIVQRTRRSTPPAKNILVYADPVYDDSIPRLRSTRDEALSIERLFPHETSLRLGSAATRESFTENDLSRYGIIHFAGHGVFSEDASKSGVVLSKGDYPDGDGLLTAEDVAGLKLNSSLVVLSACETGMAPGSSAGLTDAFLRAGAQQVVASLWPVNDFSAADFMEMFYARMREGESPSDALRNAKLGMMHSRIPYAHPHYWAPFVHVGVF